MTLKKKEVRVCDNCFNEVSAPFLKLEDVPSEGASSITFGKNYVALDTADFCDFVCFVNYLRKKLHITDEVKV